MYVMIHWIFSSPLKESRQLSHPNEYMHVEFEVPGPGHHAYQSSKQCMSRNHLQSMQLSNNARPRGAKRRAQGV